MSERKRVFVLILGGVVSAACSGNAVADEHSPVDCILALSSVRPNAIALHVGDTARFTYAPSAPCPSNPQSEQPALAFWSSSDTLVARVNANDGLAFARDTGRVTITATDRRDPSVKGAAVLTVSR